MQIFVTENGERKCEIQDFRVACGSVSAPEPGQCWFKVVEGTPLSNGATQVHTLEVEDDDGNVTTHPIKIALIIDMTEVIANILAEPHQSPHTD